MQIKVNAFGVEGQGSSSPAKACICGPQGNHISLANCPKYIQTTGRAAKWALIKEHGALCFLCLRAGHKANQCSEEPCQINGCGRRHHASLHFRNGQNNNRRPQSSDHSHQPTGTPPVTNPQPGNNPPVPATTGNQTPGLNLQASSFRPGTSS